MATLETFKSPSFASPLLQRNILALWHHFVTHLHVTMENFALMESVESFHNLDENRPDFTLREESACFLMLTNFLIDITPICIIHDQTQTTRGIFEEDLPITNNVGMTKLRGQLLNTR